MTDTKLFGIVAIMVLGLFAAVLMGWNSLRPAFGIAAPGIAARIATTSTAVVNSTASVIFGTSSCSTRIVSTTNLDGLRLTFSEATTSIPSATVGFWQAPSTTVAYDANQFGCGAVQAFSGAAQTITVSEAR